MVSPAARPTLHSAPFAELTPLQLYGILRLRSEIFVVEQDCAYGDLDGRDHEPGAVQVWHQSGDEIVATARLLEETIDGQPAGRIGRIVTAIDARSQGLAGDMVKLGIEHFAGRPVIMGAQAHLEAYYARFGFERSGPNYFEIGIEHLPMRRDPG